MTVVHFFTLSNGLGKLMLTIHGKLNKQLTHTQMEENY